MYKQLLDNKRKNFDEIVNFFQSEIASIKTGRANPALVENLEVEVYGAKMKLQEVATITVSDAKTIVIQPWDKNSIGPIEKSISSSNLNLNPVVDKEVIRIILPALTEERRKEYTKILHSKLEEARIKVRRLRDDVKREIEGSEEMREDDEFKAKEELQKIVDEYNSKLKELADKKENELLSI